MAVSAAAATCSSRANNSASLRPALGRAALARPAAGVLAVGGGGSSGAGGLVGAGPGQAQAGDDAGQGLPALLLALAVQQQHPGLSRRAGPVVVEVEGDQFADPGAGGGQHGLDGPVAAGLGAGVQGGSGQQGADLRDRGRQGLRRVGAGQPGGAAVSQIPRVGADLGGAAQVAVVGAQGGEGLRRRGLGPRVRRVQALGPGRDRLGGEVVGGVNAAGAAPGDPGPCRGRTGGPVGQPGADRGRQPEGAGVREAAP